MSEIIFYLSRTGADPCLLAWKNNFLLIGGYAKPDVLQSYNVDSKEWSLVNTIIPMSVHNSACVVLLNEDVLVVGSEELADYKTAAIYNVGKNYWTKLPTLSYPREGTSLVRLGDRIFAVAGLNDTVEEFHPNNNSWTLVSNKLLIPRDQYYKTSLQSLTASLKVVYESHAPVRLNGRKR